jgi:pyruvate formate lyase activating enzyme
MERIYRAEPLDVVNAALEERCHSIAYTYSDPIIFYEYVYDTATLAHQRGLKNIFVTAGYINPQPMRRLCQVIDGTNIDLKAFDDKFYRRNCSGSLKPVLDAMVIAREEGVWLEITNLVIPTLNDDMAIVRKMSHWIRENLGEDTPLHFSQFQPRYQMRNLPPTPVESLRRVWNEAKDAGLKYVYVDNIYGHKSESTYCPNDNTRLIHRVGFRVEEYNLTRDGRCPVCRQAISGVWA